jgi:hypothetical protein
VVSFTLLARVPRTLWAMVMQETNAKVHFLATNLDNLRHYATSRNVTCFRPDEIIQFYVIIPAALRPGVFSASYRNEYQNQKSFGE